ncbi:hypothetical protein M378DRAFT_83084 [Amanita muscaria Koide BX008]|uniref:NB-ARC domain-containing protein n=1 Tax=Amanita muscaria (strain Koide BX008) TaxID=946122 RepID=A0A0C2WHM0_AMAMK|nr:hypothetical protein M378DRAFT_83084 [Amanita muscaria Koide BX008]
MRHRRDHKIYVLPGLAGIGKSTVAYTIAARADELDPLGASFCISWDESDRKNAKIFSLQSAANLLLRPSGTCRS